VTAHSADRSASLPRRAARPDAEHAFEHALLAMDRVEARRVFERLGLEAHTTAWDELVLPVLERMGAEWEAGRLSLAQVYMGARICEDLVGAVTPAADSQPGRPSVAIGVLDDSHALGKRIVLGVVRAAGFAVTDLGSQLSAKAMAEQAIDSRIDVLLVSTLMLRSALQVDVLTRTLRRARAHTRVVVGGAPFRFDRALWQAVGADAMGGTASDALRLLARLAPAAAAESAP